MEKYKVKICCDNCGNVVELKLPIKTLVKEYVRKTSIICNNCKCRIKYKTERFINPQNI